MKKYIGDKRFYRMVLAVVVPIMIQNGITNFVSLLDNIMVGQVGTEQMSGVAIANQLIFVFNLCIFGAVSGAGIFGAQFYGSGDHEGVRDTLRFKLVISVLLFLCAALIFTGAGEQLIRLYLSGESESVDPEKTLAYGMAYLRIMIPGLLPCPGAVLCGNLKRDRRDHASDEGGHCLCPGKPHAELSSDLR